MAQAGDAYAAKRRMMKELTEKNLADELAGLTINNS